MDIHYKYNKNEKIILNLLKVFPEFKKDYSIPITFSDEIPQLLKNLGNPPIDESELTEFPIDELMGAYFPETRSIKIYLQGIHRASNDLQKKIMVKDLFQKLMQIVIIHEIGHYWFHNIKYSEENPIEWIKDERVNEWIAQMFTYLVIKGNLDLVNTMNDLSDFQSDKYKSYQCTKGICEGDFKEIINVVRRSVPEDRSYDVLNEKNDIKFIIEAQRFNQ